MSSVGEYKTVGDVISDLNVMIVEAPLPNRIACKLAEIVGELAMNNKEICGIEGCPHCGGPEGVRLDDEPIESED